MTIAELNRRVQSIDLAALKTDAFDAVKDDIVIFNPSYSVLNENIQSHQPKRRSEGVVMGSIFKYDGSDGEGEGKLVIKLKPNTEYTLQPTYQDGFNIVGLGGNLYFQKEGKGKSYAMKISISRARNIVYNPTKI